LLLFNLDGDCLAAKLRPGNVHSAEGWEELLLPEIERQEKLGKALTFRADAAFAKPDVYEALESRGVKYAIRIPANEAWNVMWPNCCRARWEGLVTNRSCGTRAFSTRLPVGRRHGE
jgi:hypothetical protein